MLETAATMDRLRSFGLAMLASVLPPGDQSAEAQFLRSHGPLGDNCGTPGEHLDRYLAAPAACDRLLLQLGDALGLNRIELLVTAIAAGVETDLMCGRAIAHLQAPVAGSRPTFGLLAAAFNKFGEAGNVIAAILTGAAAESGLLQILNDGAPLAERTLCVPVPLSLALDGQETIREDTAWPGMTLGRMPIFVWVMLTVSGMTLVVLSPLSAAQIMLALDRYLGAHFFDTQAGGSAVMWQHFFWFFGHPEVYILMLPGFGFVSEIIPVFSRKVIFGYATIVAATVSIGLVSLSVWAHHMFAVGMGAPLNSFFALSTMLISVPTGIKIFNWLATMYGGRLQFKTPLLFCCAFLFQFLCAGLTGVMLAVAPFDWQLTDSYFVVAHFHFVLVGSVLFTIFAAIYYWFPKVTGRMLSERLGRWHFWLLVIGFNLTFITMHVPGILGMPRRIYTYQADRGWEIWNLVTTLGVPLQLIAVLIFVVNVVLSLRRGTLAGDDPWDAWTLEWATTSPPPSYNFDAIPVTTSRRPLWDLKHPDDPDGPHE